MGLVSEARGNLLRKRNVEGEILRPTSSSPDAGRRWGRGSTAQCLEERIKQRGYDLRPEDQHSDRNLGPVYQGYTYPSIASAHQDTCLRSSASWMVKGRECSGSED